MKIAVLLRQVPDSVEPLEVAGTGNALDYDAASFIINEPDDHALEQALLLKEAGAADTVVALALETEFASADDILYTAAAKGADEVVKVPWEGDTPPSPLAAAALAAEAMKDIGADLVMVGVQANDELEGVLAPALAYKLGLPYLGVVRGVDPGDAGTVIAYKEYPGAVKARMRVTLPAVLGILAASQPPRYVPVSRIRAAMKSAEIKEKEVAAPSVAPLVTVTRMYPPEAGERAEMLEGSEAEVAARIVEILKEKGLVK